LQITGVDLDESSLAYGRRKNASSRYVLVEPLVLILKTTGLFIATALAEIVSCFLPYLWLRKGGSIWLLIPAAMSLALFVWLLTLHPAASDRVYAAYGGVYVAAALVWLRVVDGVKLSVLDWVGAGIALFGMSIILETAVGRARVCVWRVVWQGATRPHGRALL
jgi:small multidrug resistance family-3 protein